MCWPALLEAAEYCRALEDPAIAANVHSWVVLMLQATGNPLAPPLPVRLAQVPGGKACIKHELLLSHA